jgi:DNA-binding transcriptional LysR family regulator
MGRPGSGAFLPWDDLQYFLELVQKATLTKAARRLGVSHTTVLRHITNLERQLDRKLFDRTPTGFVVTEAGQKLLAHVESMASAADGIAGISQNGAEPAGAVRLAVVEGLSARVLVPALSDFLSSNPRLYVEIVTAMESVNLTKREADISISLVRPTGPRLITRRLAKTDVHLYATDRYLEIHGRPECIEDLDRHVFVDYIEDLIEIPPLKWLRGTIGQRRLVFRTTSPLGQLSAVRSGIGIGMFPAYMVRGETLIRPLLERQVQFELEFWLTIHEDLRDLPRMKAVFAFIKRIFQADEAFHR